MTGRYLGDRRCFSCLNQVKDEEHALLHYQLYQEIRQIFFEKIQMHNINFVQTTGNEKLFFVLSNSDDYITRQSAKNILRIRRNVLYK